MKFRLTMTKHWVDESTKEQLESYGFKFEKEEDSDWAKQSGEWRCDLPGQIELNTLEELVIFSKKWGELVVTPDEIEIYNGYRE